jgi:hypothetical protein
VCPMRRADSNAAPRNTNIPLSNSPPHKYFFCECGVQAPILSSRNSLPAALSDITGSPKYSRHWCSETAV